MWNLNIKLCLIFPLYISFIFGSPSESKIAISKSNKPHWGFFAHKLINQLAVFSLPPELISLYKPNIQFIGDHAVDPDKRRYAVEDEAPRHYIDLDDYEIDSLTTRQYTWYEAVDLFSEDSLLARGIVPWHILRVKRQLTIAFQNQDVPRILKLSSDLGHYIGDCNVPLHTTKNYNGQLTGQHGIHGFWESRIPELFNQDYFLFVGKAVYVENPRARVWTAVQRAHQAVDSVLKFEKLLTESFENDKKFAYDVRGGKTIKTYSRSFSKAYQNKLNGQIERQMMASIKMVADFWYTAWVDAGQPDFHAMNTHLSPHLMDSLLKIESHQWKKVILPLRIHEH